MLIVVSVNIPWTVYHHSTWPRHPYHLSMLFFGLIPKHMTFYRYVCKPIREGQVCDQAIHREDIL